MAVTLNTPIAWETASGDDLAMLEALQPNIIKAHVREFLTILFLRFHEGAEGRSFLKALASGARPLMKSAKTHLEEIRAFKLEDRKGTP
jgi:hypothetical protein